MGVAPNKAMMTMAVVAKNFILLGGGIKWMFARRVESLKVGVECVDCSVEPNRRSEMYLKMSTGLYVMWITLRMFLTRFSWEASVKVLYIGRRKKLGGGDSDV